MFIKRNAKKVYYVDIKRKNKYYQFYKIKRLTFGQHRTLLIADIKSVKQMVENYA